MVSLKNWWTLPRKKHKPTSWSPLYTVYFTLMDLGESNKFIINRSTPISTFLSSRILHESKKTPLRMRSSYWVCWTSTTKNIHLFKTPRLDSFIHQWFISTIISWKNFHPSMHGFLPGHKLATCSFGHGQRNQWCKQYEARIAFGTRFFNPKAVSWIQQIVLRRSNLKRAPLHLAKMYSKWR